MWQRPFIAEGSARYSLQHQLHTMYMRELLVRNCTAVFPPNAGGFQIMGVCVPLALSLSFDNSELNCSTA